MTEKEKKKKNEVVEFIVMFVVAIAIALAVRAFLFSAIIVDGVSMMPTLEHQDRMIVNKINYRISDPKRFDVIVFHAPEGTDYIKRVIGLPGDEIEYKDDKLYINGKLYEEPYLEPHYDGTLKGSLTEDFTLEQKLGMTKVPEDHLFVLGDNRRQSNDSRNVSVGFVPIEDVVGTTKFIFWPLQDFGTID
ncbi:signal peptidase I [Planococcaceae bacterium Storch 2/2-2]|nr:signal peptidase I [Planococcaceae bacterium Storch 2/2-2]